MPLVCIALVAVRVEPLIKTSIQTLAYSRGSIRSVFVVQGDFDEFVDQAVQITGEPENPLDWSEMGLEDTKWRMSEQAVD